jgi:hypothetical protein
MDVGPEVSSLLDDHPPKPRLTLRIGITGHRPKPHKFPASSYSFVKQRLGEVFASIDSKLAVIAQDENSNYSADPHKVRLVSGLAEGADQMAVMVKPESWALDAILPFPHDSYAVDFRKSAAGDKRDVSEEFEKALKNAATIVALPDDPRIKKEGMTPENSPDEYWRRRNAGYSRLGGFLLRQIDVLVVVWDGKREEGTGGTAEVVNAAIDAGIPVVWISTLENTIARMVEDIDDDGRPIAPDADCLCGSLADAITAIVVVPAETDASNPLGPNNGGPNIAVRLKDFVAEKWPQPSCWITYDFFKRWMEGKNHRFIIPPETPEEYKARWAPLNADGPYAGGLPTRISDVLMPRYAWADALAVDFSHCYRTAYFNCYLMATAAVFVALFGLFSHDWFPTKPEAQLAFKATLVTIELIFIWIILHIVRRGRRERWQEKWVEYRALAEMLWDARFLAYIGEHGRVQRVGDLEPASSAWFLWYFRATIREIGLPNALLDGTYQRALLNAVNKHVIADQIHWHKSNATALHRMHRLLHRVGDICFSATRALLFLFLLGWMAFAVVIWEGKSLGAIVGAVGDSDSFLEHAWQNRDAPLAQKLGSWLFVLKNWVTFAAAFLPAMGAAVAGIRETGDFERFSERSAKTATSLEDLQREVAHALRKLTLDVTDDLLLSTAQVLTEDLAAWHSVYGHKRLELPT